MSDTLPATRMSYAAVEVDQRGGGGALAVKSLGDVVAFAEVMSRADIALRKHLRGNAGACMAITMQALRWEMDPFAVANKSYAVNDQLAYEAQLIAAVIHTRAPIKGRPSYEYTGDPGTTRQCKVTCVMQDGETREYTSPEVSKITPKNSPLWKSDEDQQLGYLSIARWARRHTPEVILGVYSPEDLADAEPMRDVTPQSSGLAQRLASGNRPEGSAGSAIGFSASQAQDAEVEDHDPTTGEVQDSPRPTETASAPSAEPEQASLASVTLASDPLPDLRASSPGPLSEPMSDGEPLTDEEMPEVVTGGYPAPDEIYHLDGETFDPAVNDGRRPTYQNGQPHSAVRRKAGLKIYEDHAPVEAPPAPEAEEEGALPPEFQAYIDAVEAAPSWAKIKDAMKAFWDTATFKAMPEAQRNKVRANTWDAATEKGLADLPDQAVDVSAFRLWIEWVEDADAIRGTLRILEQEEGTPENPGFAKKGDNFKAQIRTAAAARMTALGA